MTFEETTYRFILDCKGVAETIHEYLHENETTPEYQLSDAQSLDEVRYFKIYEQLSKENNLIFIKAVENGEVVGFAVIQKDIQSHYNFYTGSINSLFLRKEYRHKGNGKALLDYCFEVAKKHDCKAFYLIAPCGSKLEKVYQRKFKQTDSLFIHLL